MADKITPKDVSEKKDDFVLIDVREADEVAEDGTIEGAVNIPLGELIRKGRQGELDDLKGKTICTYCNGGYRGNIGADELNKKGFTAVTVDGGYAAWKEEKKKNQIKQIGIRPFLAMTTPINFLSAYLSGIT